MVNMGMIIRIMHKHYLTYKNWILHVFERYSNSELHNFLMGEIEVKIVTKEIEIRVKVT